MPGSSIYNSVREDSSTKFVSDFKNYSNESVIGQN